MKKRLALCFMIAGCIFLPILFPSFWKEAVSLPYLRFMNPVGSSFPFVLLEWGAAAAAAWMGVSFIISIVRGKPLIGLKILLKRLLCILTAAALIFASIWLPLYENAEIVQATSVQLQACAEELIAVLNENPPDFSRMPDDLPAKTAAFPFWMRRLNILGFYSFFTGEAIISPDIPSPLVPFVAVHESVHGKGVADEGLCNIRAYEECLLRGGVYAASARIWALKYLLGELRMADYDAFAQCCGQMNADTRNLLQRSGGIYENAQNGILSVFSGGRNAMGYEILAHHLAAEMDG